jgi:hypothetical protein
MAEDERRYLRMTVTSGEVLSVLAIVATLLLIACAPAVVIWVWEVLL